MKATLDNIMMVYGHEEVKSHCLSTVKLSNTKADETSTTPRLDLTVSAVFGGNEGLGRSLRHVQRIVHPFWDS
jgi:hypothetical protein